MIFVAKKMVGNFFFPPPLLVLLLDPGSEIRDPGSEIRDPGWIKIRIRNTAYNMGER